MNRHARRLAKKQERAGTAPATDLQGLLVEAVAHHHQGRLAEAEKLYRHILSIDEHHADSLHLLGVIAFQCGQAQDSLDLIGRAITINDRAPHYHNNMGNTLRMLGRAEDAALHYRRALALQPDYAEAHNNLGIASYDMRLFDEAEESYKRALALSPGYVDALINLGNACIKTGRGDEAFAYYERASSLAPGHPAARYYAATVSLLRTPVSTWEETCRLFLSGGPSTLVQKFDVNTRLAIHYWLRGDFDQLSGVLKTCGQLSDMIGACPDLTVKNSRAYADFLLKLHAHYAGRVPSPTAGAPQAALIGDSHSLTYAHTALPLGGKDHVVSSHLIMGCKAWHFAQTRPSEFSWLFDAAVERIASPSRCFLTFGEIDCRFNEGILGHFKKHGGDLRSLTENCVRPYVRNVAARLKERGLDASFLNVPAPHLAHLRSTGDGFTDDDARLLIDVIRLFNAFLRDEAERLGCSVIDVYRFTAAPDGNSTLHHHLDGIHLKPEVLALALRGQV